MSDVELLLDVAAGESNVDITVDVLHLVFVELDLDVVEGDSSVFIDPSHILVLDAVQGSTAVRIIRFPYLGSNTPILLGFSATMRLESLEPLAATGRTRAVAGVVVNLPEPAISGGHPSLPDHWAQLHATAELLEGAAHIHAIADPNPVWNPTTSGWTIPPPIVVAPVVVGSDGGGVGDFRWSLDTLPDPAGSAGGWYWLGDGGGAPQWNTSPGNMVGPAWRSFFPFRPSMHNFTAYVGSKRIYHPKALVVNSHYAEHMWMDWGSPHPQPFTWIIVAAVMSDPFAGYEHTLLDSGRNPDSVGFPRLSAAGVSSERRISDNLPYRTNLAMIGSGAQLRTSADGPLRTNSAPGHHPRMFVAMFSGSASHVGVYDTFGKYLVRGDVRNQGDYEHRFMVFGRQRDWIGQRRASNLLMFEMRYWHRMLTMEDLDAQYAQLSSTHQFDAYRRL